jgi:hypothetical protein
LIGRFDDLSGMKLPVFPAFSQGVARRCALALLLARRPAKLLVLARTLLDLPRMKLQESRALQRHRSSNEKD